MISFPYSTNLSTVRDKSSTLYFLNDGPQVAGDQRDLSERVVLKCEETPILSVVAFPFSLKTFQMVFTLRCALLKKIAL